MSAPSPPVGSRLGRRLAIVATCLLSLAICVGLAWWQWDRFTSANGTIQNLGYVLQWPIFGLFPAFMFYRIRRLNQRDSETRAEAAPEEAAPEVPAPRRRPSSPPPEEDDELAAYNRYLRELNARDEQAK